MAKKAGEPTKNKKSVLAGQVKETIEPDRLLDNKKVEQIIKHERVHFAGLGYSWAAVTGSDPRVVLPQVVATVLNAGGTRPAWQWQHKDLDYVLMAWPKDQPLRAAVLMQGEAKQKLKPINAFPLLEGLPNDLTVETVKPLEAGCAANVGCTMQEGQNPMWFYDPLYVRDSQDLTPGVTHTFLMAGLAYGVRHALLDEITVLNGPVFEEYAKAWLEENPDKTRLDVPSLKINVVGKRLIQPGDVFGEYQIRTVIDDIDDCILDKMPAKIIYTQFPFADRPPLTLPIYATKASLKDYVPEKGHEIDAYVWLQGRVVDFNDEEPNNKSEEANS
ncbi:MAG: hypothetical protein IJU79_03985 [Desulfovibrionaceae bacterium]|nr:hypothetical protein [Desulfovibrionaceae bacterium]